MCITGVEVILFLERTRRYGYASAVFSHVDLKSPARTQVLVYLTLVQSRTAESI
jgi:hypothetical protein